MKLVDVLQDSIILSGDTGEPSVHKITKINELIKMDKSLYDNKWRPQTFMTFFSIENTESILIFATSPKSKSYYVVDFGPTSEEYQRLIFELNRLNEIKKSKIYIIAEAEKIIKRYMLINENITSPDARHLSSDDLL